MHMVSNVERLLVDGATSLDVLRATFPADTMSGAHRIQAMEFTDELEPLKSGIYGGACGYLSFAVDMYLGIAIRAGIVADSVLELEWKETEQKARALIRAAELMEESF